MNKCRIFNQKLTLTLPSLISGLEFKDQSKIIQKIIYRNEWIQNDQFLGSAGRNWELPKWLSMIPK